MTQDTKIEAVGHTAGPWDVKTREEWEGGYDFFSGPDGAFTFMADVEPEDARLIAAAPDLLKALKLMFLHSCVADAAPEDKDDDDHLAERLAYRAIAKAEGRTS